jgi:hypothetical protein
MTDTYTVTQADRDAAWNNQDTVYKTLTDAERKTRWMRGDYDHNTAIQAFARHRTEAITTLQSQLADAREALKRIAGRDGCASDHISCHDCYDSSQEANAALKDQSHE